MQTKYLLSLNAHEKIGSQTIKKILASFDDDLEKVWGAGFSELSKRLGEKIAGYVVEARDIFLPGNEIEKLEKIGAGYMTLYDKKYPRLLKEIPDCPAILYIKGEIEALDEPSIAIVGSRKYTNYGKNVAQKLTHACVDAGLAIVSGLALGVDAIVHQTAIDNEGITVGVLGCGIDKIYPTANYSLANEIIKKHGAVISEFSPGTPPLKHYFPARNRIIAGLSMGTLVIEAAEESGALITALEALDYNREVFAVPGNIDSENSKGTNQLIQKGAKLVMSEEDIFSELNIETAKLETKSQKILPETKEEKIIKEYLHIGEKLVDDIVKETGLNIISVNTALTTMEMKGAVENVGGGRFKLKKS